MRLTSFASVYPLSVSLHLTLSLSYSLKFSFSLSPSLSNNFPPLSLSLAPLPWYRFFFHFFSVFLCFYILSFLSFLIFLHLPPTLDFIWFDVYFYCIENTFIRGSDRVRCPALRLYGSLVRWQMVDVQSSGFLLFLSPSPPYPLSLLWLFPSCYFPAALLSLPLLLWCNCIRIFEVIFI